MTLVVDEPIEILPGRRVRRALDQRPISLLDGVRAKLFGQSGGGLRGSRQQHHARHRGIQPAHHAQVDVARLLVALFDVFLGQRQQGWRAGRGTHRGQPGRLVDDQEVIVFVEDFHGTRRARRPGLP